MTLSTNLALPCRILLAALLLASVSAHAQNAVRGKQLYESKINPSYLSCSDPSACHGPSPALNLNKIRNGTNPQTILGALNSVPLMGPLKGFLSATDAADIAAYIATPTSGTATSLAASASSLTFGSTQVGATNANSSPAGTTITNTSSGSITITSVDASGTNAADFKPTGTCVSASPVVVAAGATCTLGASFTPAAAGARTATLVVRSNANTNPSIALSGTGSAVAIATMALDRAAVAFPTQTISTTSTAQDLTVRNTGTAPLTITKVDATPTPEFVSSSNCVGTLIPGGSCTVVLVFTPSAAGARTGTLGITANTGATTVPLSGNSVLVPTPIATAMTTALSFSPVKVGTSAQPKSTVIANTGNAPLEIASVAVTGPDAKEFTLGGGTTCKPGPLAGQADCTVELMFQPQSGGGKSAAVTVTHNASGGSTVVAVSAQATVSSTSASVGTSALAPSNIGGGGALSPWQLMLIAATLLLTAAARQSAARRQERA